MSVFLSPGLSNGVKVSHHYNIADTLSLLSSGLRWMEAMRVVRSDHPEVTVFMPNEKMQVHPGDDVRELIENHVSIIRRVLDAKKVGEWKGYTVGHRDLSPDLNGKGEVEPEEWVKCSCFNVATMMEEAPVNPGYFH